MSVFSPPAVYMIRNRESGAFYIGASKNPTVRFSNHRNTLRRGAHKNARLQRSWDDSGEGQFDFLILEFVFDVTQLHRREQEYMDWHGLSLNMAPEAETVRGIKRSDETRAKMSAALLGNKNNQGQKRSAETKLKQSIAARANPNRGGYKLSAEFSAKLSQRNRETAARRRGV